MANAGPIALVVSVAALAVVGVGATRAERPAMVDTAGSVPGAPPRPTTGTTAVAGTPSVVAGDGEAAGGPVEGSARCADATGDIAPDLPGDLDLVSVGLQRDASGLRVRIEVRTAPATLPASGGSRWWEVMMADGDSVLYAFSISRQGATWQSGLVDFTGSGGDQIQNIKAPGGKVLEARIPSTRIRQLPARFTWWTTTVPDELAEMDNPIADACPNGAGVFDDSVDETGLPSLEHRSVFPG